MKTNLTIAVLVGALGFGINSADASDLSKLLGRTYFNVNVGGPAYRTYYAPPAYGYAPVAPVYNYQVQPVYPVAPVYPVYPVGGCGSRSSISVWSGGGYHNHGGYGYGGHGFGGHGYGGHGFGGHHHR